MSESPKPLCTNGFRPTPKSLIYQRFSAFEKPYIPTVFTDAENPYVPTVFGCARKPFNTNGFRPQNSVKKKFFRNLTLPASRGRISTCPAPKILSSPENPYVPTVFEPRKPLFTNGFRARGRKPLCRNGFRVPPEKPCAPTLFALGLEPFGTNGFRAPKPLM